MKQYECDVDNTWVYDDGAIKGVIQIENREIKHLFVKLKITCTFPILAATKKD